MKLYVANCSKQEHLFTYMIPENPRPFSHSIRAGAQIEIPGNQDALMAIIGQHQIYGMMEVNKVTKGFGGLCYRLEKPISVEAIENGFTQSDQEMINKAQESRNITAAASDQMIANKAQEMGLKQRSGLEIEVIEEKKNAADNSPKFEQVIEVVREGIQPAKSGRRKKS
jgi:hypothetical protein